MLCLLQWVTNGKTKQNNQTNKKTHPTQLLVSAFLWLKENKSEYNILYHSCINFLFLCAIQKADAENKNVSALETWIPGTLFIHRKPFLPPSSVTYLVACHMPWTSVVWRNSIPNTWSILLVKGGSERMAYR